MLHTTYSEVIPRPVGLMTKGSIWEALTTLRDAHCRRFLSTESRPLTTTTGESPGLVPGFDRNESGIDDHHITSAQILFFRSQDVCNATCTPTRTRCIYDSLQLSYPSSHVNNRTAFEPNLHNYNDESTTRHSGLEGEKSPIEQSNCEETTCFFDIRDDDRNISTRKKEGCERLK